LHLTREPDEDKAIIRDTFPITPLSIPGSSGGLKLFTRGIPKLKNASKPQLAVLFRRCDTDAGSANFSYCVK